MLNYLGPTPRTQINVVTETVDLAELAPGVHQHGRIFFRLLPNRTIAWVTSRHCDHNGGLLTLGNDGKARCPLHGWTLDLESLRYTNVEIEKRTIPFSVSGTVLSVHIPEYGLVLPKQNEKVPNVSVRFLAHASVAFNIDGFRLVTDPWLTGPCFQTGWWLAPPPKADALEELAAADMIYVSHGHPDHLHGETLQHVRRDMPIVTGGFSSRSSERMLRRYGFTNVHALPFNDCFNVSGTDVNLTILKSGDFRDDSGLYLGAGTFSALLTVDSNALNSGILPRQVDVLLTSFAGGASGYPWCFEHLPIKERRAYTVRRTNARLISTLKLVEQCRPRVYIPYAGYFSEAAERDSFIRLNNAKTSSAEMNAYLQARVPGVVYVDPLAQDRVYLDANGITLGTVNAPRLYEVTPDYIASYLDQEDFSGNAEVLNDARDYFRASRFRSDLVLYVLPTDDSFRPIANGLIVDFRGAQPSTRTMPAAQLRAQYDAADPSTTQHSWIAVRQPRLAEVIRKGLPFEELSIGFQVRIERKPDRYESTFWHHFTDEYLKDTPLDGSA